MKACAASNASGEPCRASPLRDGPFCRMHAPEHAADVADARRLGGLRRRREVALSGAYDIDGVRTPADVVRVLNIALIDTLALDNSVARSRELTHIAQVALRAIVADTFDERLAALEQLGREPQSRPPNAGMPGRSGP